MRDMPEIAWSLHPQLQNDTTSVGDLPLCRVLAINDTDYPWLILVPRRAGIVEIIDLDEDDRALLINEIGQASRVLKAVTGCDKLNIGAIGNIVAQLHIHIVARRKDDPLWPKPVWGHAAARPGDAAAFHRFIAAVKQALGD
jgi:diadenosine tetraphosphate (Ap4A) HIT family hydrolase